MNVIYNKHVLLVLMANRFQEEPRCAKQYTKLKYTMELICAVIICVGLARLATSTKLSEMLFGLFLLIVGVVGIVALE